MLPLDTMTDLSSLLSIPAARADALASLLSRLRAAQRVVLTTHVNADGDGVGSQVAVAAWLDACGIAATIVNPTPFPEQLRFLVYRDDLVAALGSEAADCALSEADLFFVLDTSEAKRVGALAERMPPEQTLVLDHHPPGPSAVGRLAVQEPDAAATGELIYDLLRLDGARWTETIALGIYVALVSDTGSYRYANTSARVHAITATLMQHGIDPEEVYGHLFGRVPRRRLELLREALDSLHNEHDGRLSWMFVSAETIARIGASHEDLEGLIEHARSLEGTEVAILFRELPDRQTKLSFRARGHTDVNRIARLFGGGGHVKASGAVIAEPPDQAVPKVLAAVREALGE
jgi:bifunctional oligoribonuclease and PAP phosphatase NrnA